MKNSLEMTTSESFGLLFKSRCLILAFISFLINSSLRLLMKTPENIRVLYYEGL